MGGAPTTDVHPGPEVTVDERLVPFRGRCPFKQYIRSKQGKYGIKIWAACDARSSYAWNMQVYTGKPVTGRPEKKQGMRVVLDMTAGLNGHNIAWSGAAEKKAHHGGDNEEEQASTSPCTGFDQREKCTLIQICFH